MLKVPALQKEVKKQCLIALAVVCRLWISRNDRVFKQKSTEVLLNELLALQLKMTLKFHILV
ncbi:hypothetical protein HanRHA438_Chr08g0371581 [Helianthus annuus]|nr:hypothetical protein HanIR_Chr08g0388181 [Helianthus annuus]KAJ0720628.1 hypothetical protein HanLR1_Chr08g0295761 [Helianthus annuus]KAJ0723819.1 hypothetical protein HanOQP8_Chr08g0302891 [Helianthus annuus]KAJ0899698.1 hypothetical protein HanRHA438_Chr08g0371581 [Helianthus annuus]